MVSLARGGKEIGIEDRLAMVDRRGGGLRGAWGEGWGERGRRTVWHGHEYFASALIYAILCAGSFTTAPSFGRVVRYPLR